MAVTFHADRNLNVRVRTLIIAEYTQKSNRYLSIDREKSIKVWEMMEKRGKSQDKQGNSLFSLRQNNKNYLSKNSKISESLCHEKTLLVESIVVEYTYIYSL